MGLYNPFNMLNKKIKSCHCHLPDCGFGPTMYIWKWNICTWMSVSGSLTSFWQYSWSGSAIKTPDLVFLCPLWFYGRREFKAPTFSLKGATELLNRGLWLYALSETFYVETFLMKCVNCEQNILAVCRYSMPQTWYETRTAFNVQTGNRCL